MKLLSRVNELLQTSARQFLVWLCKKIKQILFRSQILYQIHSYILEKKMNEISSSLLLKMLLSVTSIDGFSSFFLSFSSFGSSHSSEGKSQWTCKKRAFYFPLRFYQHHQRKKLRFSPESFKERNFFPFLLAATVLLEKSINRFFAWEHEEGRKIEYSSSFSSTLVYPLPSISSSSNIDDVGRRFCRAALCSSYIYVARTKFEHQNFYYESEFFNRNLRYEVMSASSA